MFCLSCLTLDFYEIYETHNECCHCCAVVVPFSFRLYAISALARYARLLVGVDL